MSVLHTLFLVIVLMWSWCTFNSDKTISDLEHGEIQIQVKEFISNYIKQNKPEASAVVFKTLYSKPLDNGDVDVVFSYTIKEIDEKELAASVSLSGKITLKKSLSDSGASEWGMESLKLDNENIEFNEPLLITPETNESDS